MIPIALHVELPPAVAASAALRPPAIVSPAPREASFGQVSGRVYAGTTRVRVLVDGVVVRSRTVSGATAFAFSLNLPARDVRISVVAQDASGARASRSVSPVYGLPRAGRPFPTRPSAADAGLGRRQRSLAGAYPGPAAVYAQHLPAMERNLPIPDEHKNPNRGTESPIRVVQEIYTAGDARRSPHRPAAAACRAALLQNRRHPRRAAADPRHRATSRLRRRGPPGWTTSP